MKKFEKKFISHNILYYTGAISVLVLLIIAILGSYLYWYYYQTIYVDFQMSNQERLNAEESRHENDMQIINDIIYQMGIADEVTCFILTEKPECAQRLEKHLFQYTTVSQFFRLLFYQYHKDAYLYTHTTSVSAEYFLKSGCKMELTDAETAREELFDETRGLRVLPEQAVRGTWIQKYMGNEKAVIYIQAIPPQFEETMLFMVPDSYYDSLLGNEPEEQRMDYIVYGGKVIVSRGSLSIASEKLVALADETGTQSRVKIGDEKYLLSVREGKSGLVYCSLQSMDVFYNKIIAGQWSIVMLLILCFIPTTFLILTMAKMMLKKVRQMNQMLDAQEEANYNLSSIESGIQLLVEANAHKEVENLQLKKTRFIRSFIRNDFQNQEEILSAARSASMKIENCWYVTVLLGERSDSNEKRAHTQMLEVIEREKKLDGYGIHLVSNSQSLFVLFSESAEVIEETIEQLFAIGKKCYEEFVMSTSGYHRQLDDGAVSYLEANTAFDNRFLQDNEKILRFEELVQTEDGSVLSDSYLQNLRQALRIRDKAAVEQAVEAICGQMSKMSPSLLRFRLLYNNIIHVLISEWKAEGTGIESIYNVFTLSQCLTIQDFNDLLREACSSILDSKRADGIQQSDVVDEIVRYMKANFSQPELNMSVLADRLHISSVTLSVEFKNQMGIRPSDYLANLRMEKARELLLSTNMLVKEISLAVGYEDDHVFTRRFKKYTGRTPGQYREEHIAGLS